MTTPHMDDLTRARRILNGFEGDAESEARQLALEFERIRNEARTKPEIIYLVHEGKGDDRIVVATATAKDDAELLAKKAHGTPREVVPYWIDYPGTFQQPLWIVTLSTRGGDVQSVNVRSIVRSGPTPYIENGSYLIAADTAFEAIRKAEAIHAAERKR